VKAVQSLTCTDCGNKYRTMFKKGGKIPARVCPSCSSPRYTLNLPPKPVNADDVSANF
jgi:hypothetical protein